MRSALTPFLLSLLLFTFSPFLLADVKPSTALSEMNQLYHTLGDITKLSLPERLNRISARWLTRPYSLFPLGEGAIGEYDHMPRYRTDAFDCETFVDTVLAAALSTNFNGFKHCMDIIRYQQGHVSFTKRNHFTSIDWNRNNQQQGLLRDITKTIKNQAHHPIAIHAETDIDKANWYAHLPASRIRLPNASLLQRTQQLKKLRLAGRQFARQHSSLPYLPLRVLFDEQGHANALLFQQIPHGAIVEIVRPNWDLIQQIGTRNDVSHLGFVFWQDGTLIFREASSDAQQVIDIPLVNYLRQQRKNPTIQGINIQQVVQRAPLC